MAKIWVKDLNRFGGVVRSKQIVRGSMILNPGTPLTIGIRSDYLTRRHDIILSHGEGLELFKHLERYWRHQ